MSGSASIGLEQAILGHTLGFSTLPATSTAYVALCLAGPAVPPSESVHGTEVSGAGYARMPAQFALIDTPANEAANTSSVEYPVAAGSWGNVGYFELWDAQTPGTGNRLYWGQLVDPTSDFPLVLSVSAGDIVRFSPGALAVQAATTSELTTSPSGAYLPLAGGTLTGPLLLAADPTALLGAATKEYVDAHSGGAGGIGFLPLTGGTMTGYLTLVGDAASPLNPVTLQQMNLAMGTGPFVPSTNPITAAPGIAAFPIGDIYQSPDSYALTGSMTVRGQPYGYYDTGTLLSLVATTLPLSSSRAGINGGFETGLPAIAGYGEFDQATLYVSSVASPPPLVLHNVTYDATHVIPQTPLTTAQIALLRKNMWVLTNSIDTTVSITPSVPNGYKPENHYGSYVTGWASDGSLIAVVGWTVPGSGHTAAGQVPPVGTLDPGAANATAYFGSPTAHMGANLVLQHNPTSNPDDRGHIYTGIEIDIQNYGTTNYETFVGGLTMNYNPINGAKCTADSAGIVVSGFPVAINAQALNVLSAASPANWAGTPLTNLTWESQNYIDGDLLRLQCWTSRDSNLGFAGSASLHLGLRVNGTPMALTGGTPAAQLVWNPQGASGGFQIQSGAGVAAFSIDASGALTLGSHELFFSVPPTNATNDAAAAGAGVPIGGVYRNGSVLMVRVA